MIIFLLNKTLESLAEILSMISYPEIVDIIANRISKLDSIL